MVNFLTLNGSIRSDLGSANTNRLRKQGFIPAVIYRNNNDGDNIYISIPKKDFDKEYLKGAIQTRPIELNIDSKKYKVLTYQIDIDPVSDMPRHIDFFNIEGKKEVKVFVPVKYLGREKSPGLKRGGFLNILKRKIRCYVDPLNIPDVIEVNVSTMHIGDKKKINDITLPNGIRAVDKSNFNVCTITGRGKSTDAPTATTEASATPAATPAKAPEAKK